MTLMLLLLHLLVLLCHQDWYHHLDHYLVTSAEFITMTLNSKNSKVVSYIQDKKAWVRIYVLLKILFPCLCTLRFADINKAGTEKVFYYSIMTKISIIKSSTDLDNKELFSISGSSSQKVWKSSDSDTEDKE